MYNKGFNLVKVVIVAGFVAVLVIGGHFWFSWNDRDKLTSSRSLHKVVESFTFELNINPSKKFEIREGKTERGGLSVKTYIVSENESVPFVDAVYWGGSLSLGNYGPVVSTEENFLAFIDIDDRAIYVSDTDGTTLPLTSKLIGTTTDARTGIHGWNTKDNKLLFSIGINDDCDHGCIFYGMPKGVDLGYHIADFQKGEVIFLSGVSTSSPSYEFKGWLNENVLIFESENIIYEYDITNTKLFMSSRFGDIGANKYYFTYIGASEDSYIYIEGKQPRAGTRSFMKVRTGTEEKQVVDFGWAEIQSRAVRLSRDDKFILYTYSGGVNKGQQYRYNISTGVKSLVQ